MGNRDFFTFCTSLKPVELRALGALSQVRHIAAQEKIYDAGDPPDALYIINRGMVEIVQEGGPRAAGRTYLSRGDIFGDVEVLIDLPRRHSVQTREPVSLQCFARENIDELTRRVPAFFHYLSERLASRLFQARNAALSQSHCLELSGYLANFDLVTIYQTIVHSSQTGELTVRDERDELLASFHFDAGRICGGQFEHLTGEEAFEQLFLAQDLRGTFAFSSAQTKGSRALQTDMATRDPAEVLIHALQSRDELDALRKEMPDSSRRLLRQKLEVALDGMPNEVRAVAQKIWRLASGGRLQLCEIYHKLEVSELKIYVALRELVSSGQLELASNVLEEQVA
ncbi:MAG: cyclic nucleotide-binding domain-containing protein [Verrucomicrobiota bacterium]|nr:cyclic nucleotide-binding domain-containing protein [Verrucomicrobiota bacterium]